MKYGIIAIVAVVALSVGITAVVSAQSPEAEVGSDAGSGHIFIGKLAEILGLDDGEVADAFKQAGQEIRGEMQEQHLQNAIDEGLITEEEADQIRAWRDSRPEAMQQLGPQGRQHMRNTWRHQMNLP